ncbi:hypothetical protein QWZ18_14245, partial [Methylobacterium longum]|nr:hypothetical protein [Methylobacterium longum]
MSQSAVRQNVGGDLAVQRALITGDIAVIVEQASEQAIEVSETTVDAVLPPAPFVVGGLRLDWAAKRSLDVGVA